MKPSVLIDRKGIKRPFNEARIREAILKCSKACESSKIEDSLESLMEWLKIRLWHFQEVHLEKVQDLIEEALFHHGFADEGRAYIRYRWKKAELRGVDTSISEAVNTIDDYLLARDWRVKANANQGYSIGGLILNVSGKVSAAYWRQKVYPEMAGKLHQEGAIYIHDQDMLSAYCCGHSLKQLLREGFNGVPGKIGSAPPKYFSSALGQMVNFLGSLQNEFAGAQAFSDADLYLAPYVRNEKLPYRRIKQEMQSFVFSLNASSRWGSQCPFTNLTFSWTVPEDLKAEHPFIAGKEMEFTYGDLKPEMDAINKAFIEVLLEGDWQGRPFSFPIPTYNILPDFDWDSKNTNLLFKLVATYGSPYFQNYVSSGLDPKSIRAMCCRLQLDKRELFNRGNGLFGSGEQTGSIGVITVNMSRLGYMCKGNKEKLFSELGMIMDVCRDALIAKRKFLDSALQRGLYPYVKRYIGRWDMFFLTIGVNGMNECIRNFTDDSCNLASDFGLEFGKEILTWMRERTRKYQMESGFLFNLEATPAEGATYRLAKADKKKFPDIITAGSEEEVYYTNSSQLPVDETDDLYFSLRHQEPLQVLYSGGTVFHIYINTALTMKAAKDLVKKAVYQTKIPYLTVSPTFSICCTHGRIPGVQEVCPECGQSCEIYSRVMGYYRPTFSYNKGKLREFKDRKPFLVK